MDGRGEKQTALLASADASGVHSLVEVEYPHSLGLFYGTVTQFLGFRPDSDEWKVMALASYESADNPYYEPMRELITVHDDGTFSMALEFFEYYNHWHAEMYGKRFVDSFGPPRAKADPIEARHKQIAAALQRVFEETLNRILAILHARTGMQRVVVSGGCFMNSVYNGKITAETPFDECFITSCPDDSGTSIGAALWLEFLRTGTRPAHFCEHNYWGDEFSDAECRETLEQYKIPFSTVEDPSESAAADVEAGKLVGWFQGRCEFGQRALGNRSILADPRRAEMKDIINAAVKFRESFRPFAPAILKERVADYFVCHGETAVPFMERVLPFIEAKKEEVPAVVHADGTGRLQTVDEKSSPRYHALIRAFEKRTGVPIVLNTSFNLNGQPIVNSPTDAIQTFYSCGLDVLYLGDARVAKDERK